MTSTPSPTSPPGFPERYLATRRPYEIAYWLVTACLSALGGSYATWADHRRNHLGFAWWEPAVWSSSSALLLLALVPGLLAFTRRWPLHLDTWRRNLGWYVLASLVWSWLHVAGMVALRKLGYAAMGTRYDFGDWPVELLYEYSKDVRTFLGLVVLIHGYRLLVRLMQGEASVLGLPDSGIPVEPLELPARFLVRKLGREFLIATADIERLQASGNYVNLHVAGRDYPLRSTIGALLAKLDPACFARVHRSHVVNMAQIASIEPLDTGDARIHLKDGGSIPCSRRYRDGLRGRA